MYTQMIHFSSALMYILLWYIFVLMYTISVYDYCILFWYMIADWMYTRWIHNKHILYEYTLNVYYNGIWLNVYHYSTTLMSAWTYTMRVYIKHILNERTLKEGCRRKGRNARICKTMNKEKITRWGKRRKVTSWLQYDEM